MKLIKKNIERDASGAITLVAEEPEDMYNVYNLIQIGDQLRAPTIRRVQTESSTGSSSSQRVRTTLTIRVTKLDFDSQASELHVSGTVILESPHVKLGSFHTLDLELHRNFTLAKQEWDSEALRRVEEACDPGSRAEVGAVVLQEGLANVCLITNFMTIVKQRIEVSIPRKARGSSSQYQKGLDNFFKTVYDSVLRHLDPTNLKVILLASPGFLADSLSTYIFQQATLFDNKALIKNRSKFVVVHCSTGHVHALNEVMKTPAVERVLSDTKYAKESQAMEKFYSQLSTDDSKAWYGATHVRAAVTQGAVSALLISDTLFRSHNIETRKEWVRLADEVRSQGGEVLVFSSLHESGRGLDSLTGVAAVLKWALPELEELEEAEEAAREQEQS
ncbi:translation release factor eRF1 [Saitoella complicata NRRL Y-17804]|uniref:Protein DOM34 homolog n=1 Tax=Saitoella complicata (strain BCRC 22490 / CBS 7301 / JCM 7358 / NBRC 10748 / NRRL Y-17804) TaxID=698492 RepID=A0A0E9NFR8_SAICN|nr:translation release factor eRF1 [Saitoella complicata NRRL Y-17804]ODQ51896.1 translation release factor eRF1 [Saitoella complicata NRRL Y-17804]GAO48712.1 hypothetical protein G7K_2882-t1 [Saitoella complicata NRRL Y-17804]